MFSRSTLDSIGTATHKPKYTKTFTVPIETKHKPVPASLSDLAISIGVQIHHMLCRFSPIQMALQSFYAHTAKYETNLINDSKLI
jgi:hypothetical protein